MNASLRRRAAVGGGALTVALGVGLLAAPAANALDVPGVTSGTGSGIGSTVSGVLGGGSGSSTTGSGSTTPTTGTAAPDPSSGSAPSTPSTPTTTTPSAGGSTAPDPTGTVGSVSSTTPVGGVSLGGVTVGGSAPTSGTTTGTGIVTGTGGGGTGVSVGAGGAPVVTVTIGGSGSGSVSTGGSGDGTATITDTTTTTTTQGTALSVPATPGAGGTTSGGTTSGGTTSGGTAAGSRTVQRVLTLAAAPSTDRVYPMKDGYRDDVLFRLASTTADGSAVPVDGHAVLRRGAKVITRWRITSSDQALRWNGRDHSRVVPGTYAFTATVRDASGAVFTTATSTVVSAKRLVPATTRFSSTDVTGTHRMATAPRKALATGTVRLRITTIASHVKGAQRLIFEKNGRRIVVPITQGKHTSRTIAVPKDFTSFTLKHTWKKGAVRLQKVRYAYSYSSLR